MAKELKFKSTLFEVSIVDLTAFAQRHNLSREEESRFFRHFLSPRPGGGLGAIPPPDRTRRRRAELGKMEQDLRRAAQSAKSAVRRGRNLIETTPLEWHQSEHPAMAIVSKADLIASELDRLVSQAQEKQSALSGLYPEPTDQRKSSRDRTIVIDALCEFWARCGRPLTVTTNPVSNKRTGPLIDFLGNALQLLTDPPASLSPETLAKEIDRCRRGIEFRLARELKGTDPSKLTDTDP